MATSKTTGRVVPLVDGGENVLEYGTGANNIVVRDSNGLNPITAADLTGIDGSGLTGLSGGSSSVDNTLHFMSTQAIPGSTAWANVGVGNASILPTTTSGTNLAAVNDSTGIYASSTTGATAGLLTRLGPLTVGTLAGITNTYHVIKTPSTLSAIRMWYGFTDSPVFTVFDTTDSPFDIAKDFIGFRFSTSAGDTTWWIMVNNVANGTQHALSSGVTVQTSTRYILRVKVISPVSVEFYINGALVGSFSGPASPAIPTLSLTGGYNCSTLENVAKTFYGSRIVCEFSV